MKLSPYLLWIGALVVLASLMAPAPAAAQCEGCNNLTDNCGTDEPDVQAECYEDEDPDGEPYCHAYGGDSGCDPILTLGADGLPGLDSVLPAAFDDSGALGITALTDCRGRVRVMAVSSETGESLRKQVAKIVI